MMSLFTHHKRGGRYEVITSRAHLQCSTDQSLEDTYEKMPWTIYRDVDNGEIYIRLTSEFQDGRFIEVES